MKFFSLCVCIFLLLKNSQAMQIPIIVYNDTDQKVVLKNFNLKYSSVNIGSRKIKQGEQLRFIIIPIAGKEEESFEIVVGNDTKIPIILK